MRGTSGGQDFSIENVQQMAPHLTLKSKKKNFFYKSTKFEVGEMTTILLTT